MKPAGQVYVQYTGSQKLVEGPEKYAWMRIQGL
jgi:hypothetical protein